MHTPLFPPLSSSAIAIVLSFPSGTREKTEKAEEEEEEATTVESTVSLSFPSPPPEQFPKGAKFDNPKKRSLQ